MIIYQIQRIELTLTVYLFVSLALMSVEGSEGFDAPSISSLGNSLRLWYRDRGSLLSRGLSRLGYDDRWLDESTLSAMEWLVSAASLLEADDTFPETLVSRLVELEAERVDLAASLHETHATVEELERISLRLEDDFERRVAVRAETEEEALKDMDRQFELHAQKFEVKMREYAEGAAEIQRSLHAVGVDTDNSSVAQAIQRLSQVVQVETLLANQSRELDKLVAVAPDVEEAEEQIRRQKQLLMDVAQGKAL